jgi:hypothetical protein
MNADKRRKISTQRREGAKKDRNEIISTMDLVLLSLCVFAPLRPDSVQGLGCVHLRLSVFVCGSIRVFELLIRA